MIDYTCSVEVAGQWFEVTCKLTPPVRPRFIDHIDSPDYPMRKGKQGKIENIHIVTDGSDVTDRIAGHTRSEIESAVFENWEIEQVADALMEDGILP
jgi:hypothetical protein